MAETHPVPEKTLGDALGKLLKSAESPADLDNLRAFLCQAVSHLAPLPGEARTQQQSAAFQAIVEGLKRISSGKLLWRGRPHFLTADLLSELRTEAESLSAGATRAAGHHFHPGSMHANALALSHHLTELMDEVSAGSRPTGIASYVYYFAAGDGIPPHLDTNMFSLNVLIMLEHSHRLEPSHLVLYEDSEKPTRLLLEPGEMVIFDGSALVHAREKLKEGERISILTVGFSPTVKGM